MKILKALTILELLCLSLACSNLSGQNARPTSARLNRLKVLGNKKVNRSTLQTWFNYRKGQRMSEPDARQRCSQILRRYVEHGFYFASIDSMHFDYNPDSTQVDLTIRVVEGDILKINQVTVAGLEHKDQKILQNLESKPGKTFKQETLESDILYLIDYFENKGQPFCQVNIGEMKVEPLNATGESGLDIRLNVSPGPKVTIGKIEILGTEQTKDYVILRELGLKTGDVFNQNKVEKIASNLMKLGYFKWVNPPRLEMQQDGTGKLVIELEEGSSNRMDGVIGYNPATASSKGFVTGLLDLSFGNLVGTGRQIQARWERRSQKTQELKFRYLEPWLANLPLHAGFRFEQLIQDTSYVQRSLGLDFRFLFNENLSLFSQFSKRSTSPDSLGAVLFGIPASNALSVAIGLTYDTKDNLLNPTKGVRYETSFEIGKKNIDFATPDEEMGNDKSSFEQKRITIDFESYIPLFKWQVFSLAFHGRQITSNEEVIPITDQYRFGGALTLRGYREEQFRGSRIAWSNIEYRYLLGRLSRLFLFLDAGYFFREELVGANLRKIQDAKIAYGIGFRVDTKLGFFGIDYGLGEGDSFSNGKVHIGLINEF
ncbi:MAG: outer membrane protein assembly factor [bacterium]